MYSFLYKTLCKYTKIKISGIADNTAVLYVTKNHYTYSAKGDTEINQYLPFLFLSNRDGSKLLP
jgi:hypothetical protein